MHVELANWSINRNITLDIPIPILIESCIPQTITYAHNSKALSSMVLITEIPSEVLLDAPKFVPVPDCPHDLSDFIFTFQSTDGNDQDWVFFDQGTHKIQIEPSGPDVQFATYPYKFMVDYFGYTIENDI